MRLLLSLVLVSVLLAGGCRKPDPEVQNETPVFHVQGTMGSAAIDLKAGVNGYYMYSSYRSDASNVYEFTGDLKEQNCNGTCPNSFRLRIRDFQQHSQSGTMIDSALRSGFYSFNDSTLTGTTVLFFAQPSQGDSLVSVTWNFGDNGTGSGFSPSHTYTTPGVYVVCMSATLTHNSAPCFSTICDSVYVGVTPCMTVDFSTQQLGFDSFLQMDSMRYTALVAGGQPPFTYTWIPGDATGPFMGSTLIHAYSGPGAYQPQLYVADATGCTASRARNIKTSMADTCVANFSTQVVPAGLQLSTVIIEWQDANGVLYSSNLSPQPSGSTFELLSADAYDDNENGQHTKKIHARVTCTLFSPTNGSIQLSNADIVFAIAYP